MINGGVKGVYLPKVWAYLETKEGVRDEVAE